MIVLCVRLGGAKWADKVAANQLIAAACLGTVEGSATATASGTGSRVGGTGRTLAAEAGSGGAGGSGAALGSGAFGKVGTYRYNGATVAVKELKAGADEESIGTSRFFKPLATPRAPPHPGLTTRHLHPYLCELCVLLAWTTPRAATCAVCLSLL